MRPRPFTYFAPKSVREATGLLQRYRGHAKILAGGCSLIPTMKLRLVSPEYLVDINRIGHLSYIKTHGRTVRIGALTHYCDLETSTVIQKLCPVIAEGARQIADAQVRNRGTIGGNIVHADPANDLPPLVLASDAEFILQGGQKRRIVKADDFYLGVFQTAAKPTEILTEVKIPGQPPWGGFAYLKLERKAGDFAVASAAVVLTLDSQGNFSRVRIALGAVASTAIRVPKAEKLLVGRRPDDDLLKEAAGLAEEASDPAADLRGSREYKQDMVNVITTRALKIAVGRAARAHE